MVDALQAASQTGIDNATQLYSGENFSDIVNGDTSQLTQSAKDYLDSKTNAQANQQRQQAGVQAANSIVQNGCDIDSSDCGQKMLAIVCAAIATFGGPYGAVIAAVIEALAQGAMALSKLLNDQPPCSGSGNWTGSGLLQMTGIRSPPPGTFANVVITMLGSALAAEGNCKGYYNPQMIVMAALQAWNQNSQGQLVDYFVPKPKGGFGISYIWKNQWNLTTLPRQSLQSDGYGYEAAGAAAPSYKPAMWGLFVYPWQAPYAFQPLQNVPAKDAHGNSIADPAFEGITWIRVAGNAGPANPTTVDVSSGVVALAEIVKVVPASVIAQGGFPAATAYVQQLKSTGIPDATWNKLSAIDRQWWISQGFNSQSAVVASSPHTATKILVYTGIAVGVGAAGVGAYAALTGRTFMGVLRGIVGVVNPLPRARRR